MAGWNGSGVFSRTYNWVDDLNNGINIRADRHDTNDIDFVNGVNNCIAKDGQNSATADLPMGSYKHTGVGNGTARNQYLTVGQFQDNGTRYYTTTGSANSYIITASPALTAYVAGQSFWFNPNFSNTGAATISINSVGAVAITKNGTTALDSGDIATGRLYQIVYDGTQFQIQGYLETSPTFTNISCSTLDAATSIETPLILDANGNESIAISSTTNAVNHFSFTNAIAFASPVISAIGDSTDISLQLQAKGTGHIDVRGTAFKEAEIRLYENETNGFNSIGLIAPASISSNVTFTLPSADGSNGQSLVTNGSGDLSFQTVTQTLYSGASVFSSSMPTSFTDLNLSAQVGSNRAKVMLKIVPDVLCTLRFRTNGDTNDVAYNNGTTQGGGLTRLSISSGNEGIVQLITDTSGRIEWISDSAGTTTTVTLLDYTVY